MVSIFDILNRDSYQALEDCLDGITLVGPQQQAVAAILAKKRYILNHPTGKGKTVMASAVIKLLHNLIPSRKFLFFCSKNQFIQTPDKLRKLTGLRIISISGEKGCINSLVVNNNYMAYDIIIITPESLLCDDVFESIYRNIDSFLGIVIDEIHNFTNYYNSQVGFSLLSLCRNMRYVLGLTATPITRNVEQFTQMCYMVDPNLCPEPKVLSTQIYKGEVDQSLIRRLVLTTDKYDKNKYHVYQHSVTPHPSQIGASGETLFIKTRGKMAEPQRVTLRRIINFEGTGRGIIYIRLEKILQPTIEFLEKNGISYGVINGKTKDSDRKKIIADFYQGMYKVIITDITTSLDIEADYVVFYEFTSQVKQLVGRAQRGLEGKELNIHFLFTEQTDERKWFVDHILSLSEFLKNLFDDDYDEVKGMKEF